LENLEIEVNELINEYNQIFKRMLKGIENDKKSGMEIN
jgi:hypothetical protein